MGRYATQFDARDCLVSYWRQWENEGLFIESWSGSAGYPAEMLTEGAKSWRVEDKSTLATLVNIEAEYPALADHEEIA